MAGLWARLLIVLCLCIGMAGSVMAQTQPLPDIDPPGPALPDGMVGTNYNETISASGGILPYAFAVTAGSLPPGLTFSAGGGLTGTPTAVGNFSFTVTVTDNQGLQDSAFYTLAIRAPLIVAAPDGTVAVPYGATFVATGAGTPPFTYTLVGGSLPPGLSLGNATATSIDLTGTPTAAGSYSFDMTISDSTGTESYTQTVTVDILPPVITLTPPTLPGGTVGTGYSQAFDASGGTAPYTFAITAGALPAGLALDAGGALTGTPTTVGSSSFTVTATDALGQLGTLVYTLAVQAPTAIITIAPPTLPDGTAGTAYNQTFSASGGTAPYTFAITAGALPAGLALDTAGALTGAPTTAGSSSFTVTATDAFGQLGTLAYTLAVQAPTATIAIAPPTLPDGTVGATYNQTFSASGGTAPYTFAITAGALPAGLALDTAGALTGTPTTAGSSSFTVTATDALGQLGTLAYTLAVQAPTATIAIAPPTLPDGTVGATYNQTFSASGGTAPYTFAITAGALPAGLALDTAGALTGVPTTGGSFSFTVTATDALGQLGTLVYTLAVQTPTITLTPPTLPSGTVGTGYSQTFGASGGTAPYTFAITGGALPAGLALDTAGALTGVPTTGGSSSFTVTATDALNQPGTLAYTLAVLTPTITLTPPTLPDGTVGTGYSQAFDASGGTAPYTFAITAGALPAGLALDTAGALTGTPTTVGSSGFTVTATDTLGQSGSRVYALLVVSSRPDPTSNPDVTGLLNAQAVSARSFANVQIVNFVERLETLHLSKRSGGLASPWGFWFAGTIRSGDRDASGKVSSLAFETTGLSGGADYSFSDSLSFGMGLGYGRDRTAIGHQGSRSDADAPGAVTYGSWHPADMPFYLDGMLGYQKLDFDVKRFVPETGVSVYGPRSGSQQFTSWSSGYEHEEDDESFMWAVYGRADAANANLDEFTEQGDDMYALHYGEQDVEMRRTTLGMRMKFEKKIAWGTLEPRFRVEFQRDFHEDNSVAISYADLQSGSVFYTLPAEQNANRIIVELGSLLRTQNDWIFRLDYRGIFGGFSGNEHWLRFSMEEYDD